MRNKDKDRDAVVYVEENYFRHVDQMERWRQEHQHQQAVEKKLASVSKLSFEPFDYTPLLERVPWKERSVPNFDYLLEEAKITAESRYFLPIAVRVVLLLIMVFVLIVGNKAVVLWISGTFAIIVGASLYMKICERKSDVESIMIKTKTIIEQRKELARQEIMQAKLDHEAQEDERVKQLEGLIEGDIGSIILRLDGVLPKLDIPFPLEVEIDIYRNIPLIKVWLPSKTIIPTQTSNLLSSGRIAYEDKEQRVINKQYLELCSATLIKIAAKVYENIPIFELGYILGMRQDYLQNNCLFSVRLERDKLVAACQESTGLAALNKLNGCFDSDTLLNLRPIEPISPDGWEDAAPQLIRSLHVKIFK